VKIKRREGEIQGSEKKKGEGHPFRGKTVE